MKKITFLLSFLLCIFSVSLSSAQITGPETINFDVPDDTNLGPTPKDGDGGSTNIVGVNITIRAIDATGTPTGADFFYNVGFVPGLEEGISVGTDPATTSWRGISIKTDDGSEFDFKGFESWEFAGIETILQVRGYKNGVPKGTAPLDLTTNMVDRKEHSTEFSNNVDFQDIDEVRIIATTDYYGTFDVFFFGAPTTAGGSNSAPTVTAPTVFAILEDTTTALANDVQVTDSDAGDTQTLTILVTGGTVELGTTGITFGGSGNGTSSFTAQGSLNGINTALDAATFTPINDFNGPNTGSIQITSNDGTDDSNTASVTFDITAVNDAPSFTKGANQTVNNIDGAQTITGWATNLSKGPADESGQTLSFNVSNDNNTLFNVQPAIDASGNLTFTPAPTQSGSATVTVSISDNGGTANGGVDTSANQTFTITINGDLTPPIFENTTPIVSSVTQTGFTLSTDIDEAGTIYYIIVPGGSTSPTSTQVKNASAPSGVTLIASGNQAVNSGGFTHDFSISGLTQGTPYDVYVVAQDDEATPNLQNSPEKIGVLTASSIAPSITFVDITKTYGDANFDLAATSNSPGTISYSIVAGGTGSASLSGTNNATVTIGNAGTVTIRATQAADGSFAAGTKDITLTINQRPITVTINAGQSKVYGDSDPVSFAYSTSGTLVNGDSFSGQLVRDPGENVGQYNINQGTLDAGPNYVLTYEADVFDITPRPITVTADAGKSKEFGASDPIFTYSVTLGNLVFGDTFTGTLTRDSGETVGNYNIIQGTLSLGANYTITFVGSVFEILGIVPTVVANTTTAIASNKATLQGTFTDDGGAAITERGFVYAKTSDDASPTLAEVNGTTVFQVISGDITDNFSNAVAGLSSSTEYSFIAYATNSIGSGESTVNTFTTLENRPPTFTSNSVDEVNEGDIYTYNITTSDPDGDEVTVTAATKPDWLNMTAPAGVSRLAESHSFALPAGVAVDNLGNVYVADAFNNSVKKILTDGTVIILAESHSFTIPGGIAVDNQGNVYVSEILGSGKVKKIAPDETVTVLADFGVLNLPGMLVVDTEGNVYVLQPIIELVRKITPEGTISILAESHSFVEPSDIAIDASGNVYVADTGNNKVKKILPDETVVTLAESHNFSSPRGIAVDDQGNVYVADSENNKIKKIAPDGTVTTLVESHNFNQPSDLTIDSSGNLYTIETSNKTIKKIILEQKLTGDTAGKVGSHQVVLEANDGNGGIATQSFTITVNGKPTVTSSEATDITASGATLGGTITADGGVAVTERGFVYAKTSDDATPTLAEIDGTTVIKVVSDDTTNDFSKAISGLSGNTEYSFIAYATNTVGSGESAVKTFTTVNTPPTFTSSPVLGVTEGDVYVYVPKAIDVDGDNVTISSGSIPSWLEFKNTSEPAVSSFASGFTFNFRGITVDPFGNVYAASSEGNLIYKIIPSGEVSIFAGSGNAGFIDANGTAAQFNSPTGVATDASGNVYVADSNNHAIRKITPTGDVSTIAGSGNAGYKDANGVLAEFNTPNGVVVDANGNVFVTDVLNARIRKISPSGEVTTLAGSGNFGNLDGNGTSASFGLLSWAMAIDGQGNLFVTDLSHQNIRKITPDAVVTTLATNIGSARGITVDTDGNVYTSDENNHIIRKIDPSGTVTTFAGSGNQGNVNGLATSASFFSPNSLAIDAVGNLYLNDNGNGVIKKIQTTLSNVLIGETNGQVGTHSVDIEANDGNGGSDQQTFSIEIVPKPEITFTTNTTNPTNTSKFTVTFNFNTPVTGFNNEDIVVVNATKSSNSFTAISSTIYTVDIEPDQEGEITIGVLPDSAKNAYNGGNTLAVFNIEFDITPPESPKITSISDYSCDGDTSQTGDNTLMIFGSANPNTTVEVFINKISIGTTTANAEGNFSYDHTGTELEDATHVITATTKDTAGNTSLLSEEFKIIVNSVDSDDDGIPDICDTQTELKFVFGFTPNGDGINDTFEIKGVSSFPNNKLTVYNRNGQIVFEKKGYSNEWDGTYKGNPLPASTYTYAFSYGDGKPMVIGNVMIYR